MDSLDKVDSPREIFIPEPLLIMVAGYMSNYEVSKLV